MKAILLTAAAFLAFAGGLSAQNLPPDYLWEVGINGGASVITRPLGPTDPYQGTRTKIVADYSARLNYYPDPHWMLTADIGTRKWETYATWQLPVRFGQYLQPRDVSFLEAAHAITENVGINYVVPFYTKYSRVNSANLYFGATVGLVTTVNDGSSTFSTYKSPSDSGYKYMSSYHYSFGFGYSYGIQAGFTYYILPRLGVNIDLAMRYASVHTTDQNYRKQNDDFYLLYFPETIGVRWRF